MLSFDMMLHMLFLYVANVGATVQMLALGTDVRTLTIPYLKTLVHN
jgi:hypothetical protein